MSVYVAGQRKATMHRPPFNLGDAERLSRAAGLGWLCLVWSQPMIANGEGLGWLAQALHIRGYPVDFDRVEGIVEELRWKQMLERRKFGKKRELLAMTKDERGIPVAGEVIARKKWWAHEPMTEALKEIEKRIE